MTYETRESITGNFCSPLCTEISAHSGYLIYFRAGFSCSCRLRMLQQMTRRHIATYKGAVRYDVDISKNQNVHQVEGMHFL